MNKHLYIGVDPSFTRTGVVIIDINNKIIDFHAIQVPGKNDGLDDIIGRSRQISQELNDLISERDTELIIEEPLLYSLKAASLGILSGVLISSFYNNYQNSILNVYSVKPSYVTSIKTTYKEYKRLVKEFKKTKKQVSLYIVNHILDNLANIGFTVNIHNPDKIKKDGTEKTRKLSHDEADAFLLVLALLRFNNQLGGDIDALLDVINENFTTIKSHQLVPNLKLK